MEADIAERLDGHGSTFRGRATRRKIRPRLFAPRHPAGEAHWAPEAPAETPCADVAMQHPQCQCAPGPSGGLHDPDPDRARPSRRRGARPRCGCRGMAHARLHALAARSAQRPYRQRQPHDDVRGGLPRTALARLAHAAQPGAARLRRAPGRARPRRLHHHGCRRRRRGAARARRRRHRAGRFRPAGADARRHGSGGALLRLPLAARAARRRPRHLRLPAPHAGHGVGAVAAIPRQWRDAHPARAGRDRRPGRQRRRPRRGDRRPPRRDGDVHLVPTGAGRGDVGFAPRAAIARLAQCDAAALPEEGGAAIVLGTATPRPPGFATGVAVLFETP
jgi:hypothetical protein